MKQEHTCRIASAAIAAGVLLAAGCGGGGGGGTGPAPTVSTTGLVPAAMPQGAVLYSDARALRPMGDGFRWIYHSHDYTIQNVRETTVRQTAHASGGVVETDSDGHPTRITVDADGNILMSTALDLGNGIPPITIAGVELAATVRANDQHVLSDQRIADIGIDLDGDGRNDGIDVAGWNLVIGNEPVSLPFAPAPITALRVDTHASARAVLSSGATAPVVSTYASVWYAPDIGVVRTNALSSDPSRTLDDDNLLLGYDGITTGWGYTMLDAVPVTGPTPAHGPVIQLADGVLLDNGQDIYRLDRRGNTVSRASFTPGNVVPSGRGFVRLAAGVRKITGEFPDWAVHSLADDGTLLSGDTPVVLDLGGGRAGQFPVDTGARVVSFPGADRFWVVWERAYLAGPGSLEREVVLRWVDGAGNLAPTELRLPVGHPGFIDLKVVARANDLLLTWLETDTSSVDRQRLIRLDLNGTVVNDTTLDVTVAASDFSTPSVFALADADFLWLTWSGPTATSTTPTAHGLRVMNDGTLVNTGSDPASLLAATVDTLHSEVSSGWPLNATADNGNWFVQQNNFGLLFADDPVPRHWLTFAEYAPGAGALTGSQVQERRRIRIPANPEQVPLVAFDDRLLLLTVSQGFFRPTVIWGR